MANVTPNYDELFEPFDERLFKCQWKECRATFDDFAYFFGHCRREHSSDYCDPETVCGWRGCKQFGFESIEQLYTHITVHVYYHNIMIEGYKVLKREGFENAFCRRSTDNRCDISIFSQIGFICGWKDCEANFNDYNLFVQHAGYHAIEDVTIPLIAKEKLRKIRYAKCLWYNCNKDFKTKTHLKTHILSHSWGKNYACPVCGLGFINRAQFLAHCFRQKVPIGIEKDKKPRKRQKKSEEEDETLDNEELDESFENEEDDSESQIKKLRGNTENNMEKEEEKEKEDNSVNPNAPGSIQCPNCPKVFDVQHLFQQHLARHQRRHPCSLCSFVAPYPSNLQAHMRYKHTKDRSYACRFCPAKFKTSNDLVRHVHLHSNPQAINICDICNKSYTTAYSLKRHRAEHLDVADKTLVKYRCELCKEDFESFDSIREHLNTASCSSGHQVLSGSDNPQVSHADPEEEEGRIVAVGDDNLEVQLQQQQQDSLLST